MRATKYPSDVTDEQWALIRDLIPVYPGGRPRKTDLRDVVDAVFYVLRTGCQWRYLPKDFPPKSTAWRYFGRKPQASRLPLLRAIALLSPFPLLFSPFSSPFLPLSQSAGVELPGAVVIAH